MEVVCNMPQFQQALANARTMRRTTINDQRRSKQFTKDQRYAPHRTSTNQLPPAPQSSTDQHGAPDLPPHSRPSHQQPAAPRGPGHHQPNADKRGPHQSTNTSRASEPSKGQQGLTKSSKGEAATKAAASNDRSAESLKDQGPAQTSSSKPRRDRRGRKDSWRDTQWLPTPPKGRRSRQRQRDDDPDYDRPKPVNGDKQQLYKPGKATP